MSDPRTSLQQHDLMNHRIFWFASGLLLLTVYLYPLLHSPLYIEVFDNLDSTVVWMKILAESGKILAPSHEIIPNMMHGIPRLSYGSEFSAMLWLYLLFSPETAYRINELLIHLVAYGTMWLFLSTHILRPGTPYRYPIVFAVSLYFATLPFYPGVGLSTSLLPLYIHIFLLIREGRDRFWHWILLGLLPLYTSLVFLYIFVLGYTVLYLLYVTYREERFPRRLWGAFFMVLSLYILTNYRMFAAMILGSDFVSHRVEYNVYFSHNAREAYIYAIKFFLDGWMQHQRSLMMPVLLPFVLFSMLLSFARRRFSLSESMIIWGLFALSFAVDFWQLILTNKYTLPLVTVFSLWLVYRGGRQRYLGLLMLLQVVLSAFLGLCFYEGLSWLQEIFPLLKSFNIGRAAFVQPVIWALLLALSLREVFDRLAFALPLLLGLTLFQLYYGIQVRRFSSHPISGYLSFSQYYMPEVFEKIKRDINETDPKKSRFVSYGLEPAISLYNGLYTVDGYSTNYPLSYKHRFWKVQEQCFKQMPGNRKMFTGWGSKVYLLCVDSRPGHYRFYTDRNVSSLPFVASPKQLCELGTSYLLSILPIKHAKERGIHLLGNYKGSFYKVWLYRFNCREIAEKGEEKPVSPAKWADKPFRRKPSILRK